MKKTCILAMAFLMILLVVPTYLAVPANAQARSDVDVTFYASDTGAWAALVDGKADFIQWALTKEQKEYAETDPNIQLARVDENGMFEFDLNNNYTIITYGDGVRSATNDPNVRKAIACLTNKAFIIAAILLFYGVRIDQPIAAPQTSGWTDPSAVFPNYDYEFNATKAAEYLRDAGFSDTDGNGWLNFPADWDGAPGVDSTDMPLVVCCRSDHAHRLAAGQDLITQLEITLKATFLGAGFRTTRTQWQQPRAILSPKVMGARDYQVYTGGWSVGRFPTYIFSLYHSMFWYPYGPNYITGMNKTNQPNYPDVDKAVAGIWYATSISAAQASCLEFCRLHEKYCINIPLWSYSSYWAYRKELLGVVNMEGYGIENAYTFLKAYRTGGGPIRMGTISGPSRLNILYSQWYFEYAVLDRIYTSCMSVQPYNLAIDQPWVVQDWEIGTWDDAGVTKTVVTYYIRKDVCIVAPVTGEILRYWTADDFDFTVWYNYAFDDSWQWGGFMDIRYTKIVDINGDGWNEYQVFFDDQSIWFYTAPTYPLLVKDELLDLLCGQYTDTWAQAGTEEHTLTYNVVQEVSCSLDGTPLVEGVDYIIRAGYDVYVHNVFVPLRDLTGTITKTYWYADIPAAGFYLADLSWKQTMYSLGTHYPVSMTTDPPGIGDTIVLKRNKCFFCVTPLLGEIDWVWKWVGTTKPRSGYYKIEIYDVVKATGAYCTRGDGIFNPKFFPGADIDPTDLCHIGIYDLVTITGKYAKTFCTPPESAYIRVVGVCDTVVLPSYGSGFSELYCDPTLKYTWTSGTASIHIDAGSKGDVLKVTWKTPATQPEKMTIAIDP